MSVGFIPVDELMQKVDVQTAVNYYEPEPAPLLAQKRNEIRSKCFLNCGRACETNDRALAIQADHPAKRWKCWAKECGKSGNLVSMCDLLKPGDHHGGKPKGTRFKEIAADLQAMAEGGDQSAPDTATAALQETMHDACHSLLVCKDCSSVNPTEAKFCYDCGESLPEAATPNKNGQSLERTASHDDNIMKPNAPLRLSDNEKARELVTLHAKFLLPSQIGEMPPSASRYFRMRPWLTDEVAQTFRMGYLPKDAGGDKSGGTMRDKVVYGYTDDQGEILTWFGRDTEYERKHEKWAAQGSEDREPQKFRFIKGFLRGRELFGQEQMAKNPEAVRERLTGMGLPVVAGPNDVIRLHTLGIPAVALCSAEYQITAEQTEKIARLARELAGGVAVLVMPCTEAGDKGMRQCTAYLSKAVPVIRAWTLDMYRGKFQDRDVESLREGEWMEIEAYLRRGEREGWELK